MKPDIHPEYRDVVFQDTSSDLAFVTRSTIETTDTIEWEDGKSYPLAKVEISSESHPFYTGKQILVDSGGRVERFRRRYAKTGTAAPKSTASPDPAPAAAPEPEDTAPEDTAPEDTAPEDTAPEDTAPEDTAPEDTAPEDTAPEDTAPEDTAPEDTAPEDTAADSES